MNVDVPVADDRRIEVVANGLALWHGSQQAVDATIVSPVTRLVTLNRVRTCTLAAPSTAPRGANAVRRTLSSSAPVTAAWLLSVLKSAADLARRQPPGSACSLGNGPWRYLRHYERQRVQLGLPAGLAYWQLLRSAPSPRRCWNSPLQGSATLPGTRLSCMRS